MIKIAFSCLLLTLMLVPSAYCADGETTYFFINGMNVAPDEAPRLRQRLQTRVLLDVPSGDVKNLYQDNDAAFSTMIDRVRAQGNADSQRELFKNFWKWLDDLSLAPSSFRQQLATLDEAAYVQSAWLQPMVAALRDNYYNKRRKAVVVAHSQGNFYANQLVNYLRSFDPAVAACVTVVGVATPATYVANSGSYETRSDDTVINLARVDFPWGRSILPPTWSPTGPDLVPDPSGHTLIGSYLGPNSLSQRIRNDVLSGKQSLDATGSACVLPQVCSPLRTSGGSGNYLVSHFLGTGARDVSVRTDLGGLLDAELRMNICDADGVRFCWFSGNGNVGPGTTFRFKFHFDAAVNATAGIEILLEASGHSNWNLCVDCGDGSTCN
jgi:hypothetical protein